jgi:pseudomonalisin
VQIAKLLVVAGLAALVASSAGAAPNVSLGQHHPRWATADHDLGRAPAIRLDHVTVWFARSAERQRAFVAWQVEQQTVGSSHFHEWLTPAQIGERFGASDADIAMLTDWLRDSGFAIRRVSNSRMFVEIAGTTTVAAAAFGVEFHRYRVGTRELLAIDREPTLPSRVAPIVAGMTGLAEAPSRPQHATQRGSSDFVNNVGAHFIGSGDFSKIYDIGPLYTSAGLTGMGQTIAIVGRARVLPADITNYDARMSVPVPMPTVIVPPLGVAPGAACGSSACAGDIEDQEEATLDVQRAGSVAPYATLDLIVSQSTATEDGIQIALQYAIDQFGTTVHAGIISLSFAECESMATMATTLQTDLLFQQAAAQGQTVFVASGDSGAAMCDTQNAAPPATQTLGVNYLCASGAVTCVGGTELVDPTPATFWDATGTVKGYIPEGAWNEPTTTTGTQAASTGGGTSMFIAMPPYQFGLAAAGVTGRLVPDIAFSAAAHDGYFGCLAALGGSCALASNGTFNYEFFNGTSASTPSMAAIMALLDQAAGANQGAANVRIYQLAQAAATNHAFHDVTLASSGMATCNLATPSTCNNSTPSPVGLTGGQAGFAVATGYDQVTGWGSLDVASFATSWAVSTPAVPTLEIDPAAVTIAAGDSATVSLKPTGFVSAVTFACSNQPADVTCSFSTDGAGLPTMVLTTTAAPAGVTGAIRPIARAGLLALVFCCGVLLLRRVRPRGLIVVAFTAAAACASCTATLDESMADAQLANSITTPITVTATAGGSGTASAVLMLTTSS